MCCVGRLDPQPQAAVIAQESQFRAPRGALSFPGSVVRKEWADRKVQHQPRDQAVENDLHGVLFQVL